MEVVIHAIIQHTYKGRTPIYKIACTPNAIGYLTMNQQAATCTDCKYALKQK